MSDPIPNLGTAMAVICYTCGVKVWQGDIAPTDGQVLLSAFADSVSGPACPSKIDPCPNKSATIAARPVPVTAADLADVKKRLEKLEAKVKP